MLAYNVYLCHQVAEIRPDKAAPLEDDDVPTTLCFSSRCALPMLWRSSSCARYGLLVPACSLAYFAISSSPARRLSLSLSLSVACIRSASRPFPALGTLLVAVQQPSMKMTTLSPASNRSLEVCPCRLLFLS